MKLSHLLAASGAALASYWLVNNREKIVQETSETIDLAKKVKRATRLFSSNLPPSNLTKNHCKKWQKTCNTNSEPISKVLQEI